VAAPAVRVDFLILIGKRRFKSAAMQVQFDDIGGGEPLLRQIGKEEFVPARVTPTGLFFLPSGWVATTTRHDRPKAPIGTSGQS
jgi:hypothetical protein